MRIIKVYYGVPAHPAPVISVDNERELTPEISQKFYNHSPTGFAWGYLGSGPAQLALAILLDYYEGDPDQEIIASACYQDFKERVIARKPMDQAFEITALDIDTAVIRSLVTRAPAGFIDIVTRILDRIDPQHYIDNIRRTGSVFPTAHKEPPKCQ